MTPPDDASRWWAEWQLWLVLAVVAVAILPRIDAVPFRGEEHRRMQVAEEMAARGDWVVPREQGQVFLSRPPLQQWVLAVSSWVFPDNDRFAARFPCALAVLLTSVLLYSYSRQFVGRTGAGCRGDCLPDRGRSVEPGATSRNRSAVRLPDVVRARAVALGLLAKVVGDDDVGARLRFRRGRGAVQRRAATAGVPARADRRLFTLEARSALRV